MLTDLDGGGVKGLTSLLLQQIFVALENEVGHAVHPHQYFDLIGGTSTGGCASLYHSVLFIVRLPSFTQTHSDNARPITYAD
jgi:patatin-like phospholipase/acyl hydrolase